MANALSRLRKEAGLTQLELAARVGYDSPSAVCMWESGARRIPSDKLTQIARLLNCTVDELLRDEAEVTKGE